MEKSVSGALNVLFCTQPESTPYCMSVVNLLISALSVAVTLMLLFILIVLIVTSA